MNFIKKIIKLILGVFTPDKIDEKELLELLHQCMLALRAIKKASIRGGDWETIDRHRDEVLARVEKFLQAKYKINEAQLD